MSHEEPLINILPFAYVVCGKVMLSVVFVFPQGREWVPRTSSNLFTGRPLRASSLPTSPTDQFKLVHFGDPLDLRLKGLLGSSGKRKGCLHKTPLMGV